MAKVYGYSDDVVVVEHIDGYSTEIDCYNKNVSIAFSDGTVITIGYGKENLAVWWIKIDQAGTTDPDLIICDDDEATIYSDILVIDAKMVSWELKPLR